MARPGLKGAKVKLGCVIAALLIAGPAFAGQGRCLLEVDGRAYLDSRCRIELFGDGGFSIGRGTTRVGSRYFAVVNVQRAGLAEGFWNGPEAESHAHEALGALTRDGACWKNAKARVCAWH